MGEWLGDHPFYLIIGPMSGGGNTVIDLDSPWLTVHADLLRVPALWQLAQKGTGQTIMAMFVEEGEQPYYVLHHVGVTGSGGGNEIAAWGMGKKLRDGSVQRMWLLPNGTFCSGMDVDRLGVMLVKMLGPR